MQNKATMNVSKIVSNFLLENKFDGLINTDLNCYCELINLCDCEEDFSRCTPAVKKLDAYLEGEYTLESP